MNFIHVVPKSTACNPNLFYIAIRAKSQISGVDKTTDCIILDVRLSRRNRNEEIVNTSGFVIHGVRGNT
jgi:hypothetical protein